MTAAVTRPPDIPLRVWQALGPAGQALCGVRRRCNCGADREGQPWQPGEAILEGVYYCPTCGPAAWAAAAAAACPAAPEPPPPVSTTSTAPEASSSPSPAPAAAPQQLRMF